MYGKKVTRERERKAIHQTTVGMNKAGEEKKGQTFPIYGHYYTYT